MAAAVVGSPVFVYTSGGTVTVPSGAQGVVAFHSHYASTTGSSLNTISLGGSDAFTIDVDIGKSAGDASAQSVSHAKVNSTGSQTFSFTLDHTASEGPIFCLVFVDGIDTADWYRAASGQSQTSTTNPSASVSSSTTDLVLAYNQKFNASPATVSGWTSLGTGSNNSEQARVNSANSPGASSTTFTATSSDYSSVGVISIKTGSSGVSGTLSRTNANDTSAASGTTTVTGSLSRTNTNDTSSASGTTTVVGTLAKTNVNDTSSASGNTTVTGTVSKTNNDDTSAASGSVGAEAIGTVNVTNQNDTSSASGTPTVPGTIAQNNQNDTMAASGSSGSAVSGTLNDTNQNDTGAISGTTTVVGTVSKTNNNDTSSASGTSTILGTLAKTNINDSMSASGASGNPPANNTRLPLTGVGT